jgi:hypothetical protein
LREGLAVVLTRRQCTWYSTLLPHTTTVQDFRRADALQGTTRPSFRPLLISHRHALASLSHTSDSVGQFICGTWSGRVRKYCCTTNCLLLTVGITLFKPPLSDLFGACCHPGGYPRYQTHPASGPTLRVCVLRTHGSLCL